MAKRKAEPRDYYVSVVDYGARNGAPGERLPAVRHGLLLGPYATHAAAKKEVGRGRELALAADPFACFYAFGTCSLPKGTRCRVVFADQTRAA